MLISLVQNISQELEKRHTCAVVKHKRQDKTRTGEDITNWTHPLLWLWLFILNIYLSFWFWHNSSSSSSWNRSRSLQLQFITLLLLLLLLPKDNIIIHRIEWREGRACRASLYQAPLKWTVGQSFTVQERWHTHTARSTIPSDSATCPLVRATQVIVHIRNDHWKIELTQVRVFDLSSVRPMDLN